VSLRGLLVELSNGWLKAKNEKFKGHPYVSSLKQGLVRAIERQLPWPDKYIVKASAGAGNWADVPWLSILNPSITESTQSGVYPVYLFRADGKGVYLSLGFGSTDLKKQYGVNVAKKKAQELREELRGADKRLNAWDDDIDLSSNTPLGRSYQWASAGAKFYAVDAMPAESTLVSDLVELLDIYGDINLGSEIVNKLPVKNNQCLFKPFLLLAGISGTGKTRFVREQAKASGNLSETYCLTSVRPDWHEPSDLLGYVSRLNGAPQYVTTDVLKFVAKAWRKIADSGLNIEVRELEGHGHRLVVTGTRDDLEKIPPYWLCLDEMNLAPVEQYFADYLSVLETREWEWIGDQFIYSSDALLGSETIKESNASGIRRSLGFDNDEYNELWHKIFHFGLAIPFNLIVAGTVNMDETTHGFSRKVIDRALSFDFGEFFPNNFDEFPGFGSQKSRNKLLSYPTWSTVNSSDLADTHDPDGTKTIMFLSAVNAVLKHTPFELAFRAMNELLLSVAAHQPQDDYSLKAVWDDFVMCKLLPRIEGDSDKLTLPNGKSLLTELEIVLADQLDPIWPIEEGVTASLRPDLHREKLLESEGSDEDLVLRIPCRSKIKVLWMKDRLANATFTSFWP
jgi:hypothetical protein